MRLPEMTLRNALVTPLLMVRAPLMLIGMFLRMLASLIISLGEMVPGWTLASNRARAGDEQ